MTLNKIQSDTVAIALRVAASEYLKNANNTPEGVQQYEKAQTALNLADQFEQAEEVVLR